VTEAFSPPQTTVVLPVWDDYVGDGLTDALTSLRSQGIPARIVVVDNASSVKLPAMPGVTVVTARSRLTLGEARNFGLERVQTPYVVFWDADDVMLPGTLEFLEERIGAAPELAAFACAIVEESGERHRWPRPWVGSLVRMPRLLPVLDSVWSIYPATGAVMIRTELARAAGGFADADSGEDWCLGVSLAFRGRLGWDERPGRVYRRQDGSVWARHMTARHQLRHARVVRERIHDDTGVPSWVRAALPLIQLGQYAAIGAHASVAAARRAKGTRDAAGR
jgi:glycosyltransferase involved in cell wall biosynthesis